MTNQNQLNIDTIAQSYLNGLLTITLNHNAAVVEYAATLIAAGPVKQSTHQKAIKQFKRMHDEYNAKYIDILAQYEKELVNVK